MAALAITACLLANLFQGTTLVVALYQQLFAQRAVILGGRQGLL